MGSEMCIRDSTRDESTWRRHVSVWIGLFSERGLLEHLGVGVARSLRCFCIPWLQGGAALAWSRVWQELGAGHDELALPLRLLQAAARYSDTRGEAELLVLPIEERALLAPVVGGIDASASGATDTVRFSRPESSG